MKDENNKRDMTIFTQFANGLTIQEIARNYDLSTTSIRGICKDVAKRLATEASIIPILKSIIVAQQKQISLLYDVLIDVRKMEEIEKFPIDDLPVTYFEVGVRTIHVFEENNIKTIGDLRKLTASDILRMPKAGRKTLGDIKVALGELGLTLQGEEALLEPKLNNINLYDVYRYHLNKNKENNNV